MCRRRVGLKMVKRVRGVVRRSVYIVELAPMLELA